MTSSHRPWNIPKRPWVMYMEWHKLLFAHWAVKPEIFEKHIPKGLQLETFDGWAWVGLVPFQMRDTSPRHWATVPSLSNFDELNVRTYVTDGKKRGVWFFSLDCSSPLAVRAAQLGFYLPYMDAKMRVSTEFETVHYSSLRTHAGIPSANLECSYQPTGKMYHAAPDTLEHFLTERYCLYSANQSGQVFRGEIHHAPWRLQPAVAEWRENSMGDWLGVDLSKPPELLHYSERIEVQAWLLEKV
jgi:uncharacterized protein